LSQLKVDARAADDDAEQRQTKPLPTSLKVAGLSTYQGNDEQEAIAYKDYY
jgi:hypothetical protein